MFRPIPAIIRFSSERVLVFIRFMRLCNDGEISLSVVLIITTIKRCGCGGRGGFCNVGIGLTWGAMLALVSIFLQLSCAGLQLIVYPSSISIVDER